MKYLKYFEELNSYFDYELILDIIRSEYGWGNGSIQYFNDFENNKDYFLNPRDSHEYALQLNVYLTDLQNGRLRGDFFKVPSGLRKGIWKMSIPVYNPPTFSKYL